MHTRVKPGQVLNPRGRPKGQRNVSTVLRKALNRGREVDPIRTVRGAGYALDDRFGRSAA